MKQWIRGMSNCVVAQHDQFDFTIVSINYALYKSPFQNYSTSASTGSVISETSNFENVQKSCVGVFEIIMLNLEIYINCILECNNFWKLLYEYFWRINKAYASFFKKWILERLFSSSQYCEERKSTPQSRVCLSLFQSAFGTANPVRRMSEKVFKIFFAYPPDG